MPAWPRCGTHSRRPTYCLFLTFYNRWRRTLCTNWKRNADHRAYMREVSILHLRKGSDHVQWSQVPRTDYEKTTTNSNRAATENDTKLERYDPQGQRNVFTRHYQEHIHLIRPIPRSLAWNEYGLWTFYPSPKTSTLNCKSTLSVR